MAKLSGGIRAVALKLEEGLMQGDVCTRLRDTIADYSRTLTGSSWGCYYVNHDGDGETGNVIYSCDQDTRQARYEIGSVGGKATCNIDFEGSVNVVPTVTYQPEAEDSDHYTAMQESLVAEKLYSLLPVYERFISKDTRKAASSDDFAGKGRSFPILKQEDISAALHSIGRAGPGNYSSDVIRTNVKRIATRKGFTLPDSLKGVESAAGGRGAGVESATAHNSEGVDRSEHSPGNGSTHGASGSNNQEAAQETGARRSSSAQSEAERGSRETYQKSIQLVESASTLDTIRIREARADYEIKLIAPGKGSSAFYPAEVLKRDGPKVFSAGTHVYLNHPTRAEEAARPEGDVKNLAGVLTTAAAYHESHAKGPGLYARMKVFADHGQLVEEKAAHVGMSIRAEGVAESGQTREGRPVLKQLVSAESVDVVTRAGAGGMILQESATGPNNQGDVEMTKEEITALVEAGVTAKLAATGNATLTKLMERAQRGDATVIATRVLGGITLPEPSKQRVIEAVLMGSLPLTEAGEVDEAKLTPLVEAAAKKEGAYVAQLTGNGRVVGMGGGPAVQQLSEADRTAEEARAKAHEADAISVFTRFGLNEAQAKMAAGKAA